MADYYSRLLEWRRTEGAARGLSKLPHDFYGSTRSYLEESRRVFERELREDPGGRKGEVARQTYQRASQVARDIVEARMTKILSVAFQASIGGGRELGGALPEERALFDEVAKVLGSHRSTVAPFLAPVSRTGAAEGTPTAPPGKASAEEGSRGSRAQGGATADADVVVVRVLRDQRAIETRGEVLDLRKEDVLTVPADVGSMLESAHVVERVRATPPPSSP